MIRLYKKLSDMRIHRDFRYTYVAKFNIMLSAQKGTLLQNSNYYFSNQNPAFNLSI